jgi:uncharacterized FlaG/YvyC family protein
MRIDGTSPIPAVTQPAAREAKASPAPETKAPVVKDRVDVQTKPEIDPTNVLVEMQPGNIVVYKFIDQASGRLIQQIPSEQMLSISEPSANGKKRT